MLLRFTKKYFAVALGASIFTAIGFILFQLAADKNQFLSMANAAATSLLSLIAIFGIGSWQKEYKNKQRHEAAIDFAVQGRKSISALNYITSPFMTIEAPDPKAENQRLEKAKKTSEAISRKIDSKSTIFDTFGANSFRYKILLGDQAESVCLKLLNIIHDINYACEEYVTITEKVTTLSSDEELENSFFNRQPMDEDNKQRRESFENMIDEITSRMQRKKGSKLKAAIEELTASIDTILKENTF